MKTQKILLSIVSIIAICTLLAFASIPSNAADKAPGPPAGTDQATPSGAPDELQQLASKYVIDFLAPENAPDKTLTIKNPKGANISATWVDPDHGYQELTNVAFDGEVLTFNALSGTPGDEYFYFQLNLYGSYLVGYAKTQDMHKSPVIATPVK